MEPSVPHSPQDASGVWSGHVADPPYERVFRHRTGHAEAVEVWSDPAPDLAAKAVPPGD